MYGCVCIYTLYIYIQAYTHTYKCIGVPPSTQECGRHHTLHNRYFVCQEKRKPLWVALVHYRLYHISMLSPSEKHNGRRPCGPRVYELGPTPQENRIFHTVLSLSIYRIILAYRGLFQMLVTPTVLILFPTLESHRLGGTCVCNFFINIHMCTHTTYITDLGTFCLLKQYCTETNVYVVTWFIYLISFRCCLKQLRKVHVYTVHQLQISHHRYTCQK